MDAFTIFPAIDLRRGRVVRLRQGDPAHQKEYSANPLEVALRWLEAGVDWLHVVNLDGAFDEQDSANQRALAVILKEARRFGKPVQFGGGLRTLDLAARALEAGVQRVVLGTAAVEDPQLAAEAVSRFGAEHVAVSLDALDGVVQVHGWLTGSGKEAIPLGRELAALGVETLIFTNVAQDGTNSGVDVASAQTLAAATRLRVIAAGGVSALDQIRAVRQAGLSGVILGRALYEGVFSIEEALRC